MKEGAKIIELNFNGGRKRPRCIHYKRLDVRWTVCPVSQESPICSWYGEKTLEGNW